MHLLRKHHYNTESCHLIKRNFYIYISIFIVVKDNTKENKIKKTPNQNKKYSFFWPLSAALLLFLHVNIGQLMTDQECHTRIIFFFEKKVISHMTFGIWLTGQHCIML